MMHGTVVPLVETIWNVPLVDTFKPFLRFYFLLDYNVWGSKAKPHCC